MPDLPHCKYDTDHFAIVAREGAGTVGPDTLGAQWAEVKCAQHPDALTSVILVGPIKSKAKGMHLVPEVAAWAAGNLRALASVNAEGSVDWEHKVSGELKLWHSFTPDGARDLAQRINLAMAAVPR